METEYFKHISDQVSPTFKSMFDELDPTKKDGAWASKLITYFRQYWQPLISEKEASEGMDIILSRYNVLKLEKMFKNPKKLEMEFLAIAIMEKVRNVLVGESVKAGIGVNIEALDPVSEEERKKDQTLLENRGEIEDLVSYLHESIGLPQYNMKDEKKISGKDPFNGNVEMFDELGLDSNNPQDRGYFMKAWHRLKHEMDAQEIVNAGLAYNEVEEFIEGWVNEIMGQKVIAKTSYVNEMTGAMEHRPLIPSNTYCIPGKRDDGKDAVCIGYVETVTVGTLLRKIGNEFNMREDWQFLVHAINYFNKTDYTGISDGRNTLYGSGVPSRCIHTNILLNFKVQLWYIEFKTQQRDIYQVSVDETGRLTKSWVSYNYEAIEDKGYTTEDYYNEYTYKTFFLSTSSNTQKLYKYGKLYHQQISGSEDEYSSYTIGYKKLVGPTVAEIAKPWIELAQEAFTKFRWMVRRAKPRGRSYNYESLVQIAKHMIKDGKLVDQIHQVIEMFQNGVDEMYTIPKVGGKPVGGGIMPHFDLPNGLDPTALSFQGIIDWAVQNIQKDLAMSDTRMAYSPKQNDVYKLQEATAQSSRDATAYIGKTLDWIVKDIAKSTLLFSQDIVAYPNSKAYKFLLDLVGASPIQSLKDLKNVALHRYGVFVNSFSSFSKRQQILADTQMAFQNKEISYEVKILIDSISDYKKARYILAFEKIRSQKQKDQEAALMHQRQMEVVTATHDAKMNEINAEGTWGYRRENVRGQWLWKINSDDNATKLQANREKGVERHSEIEKKADATIQTATAKKSLENQEPLPI